MNAELSRDLQGYVEEYAREYFDNEDFDYTAFILLEDYDEGKDCELKVRMVGSHSTQRYNDVPDEDTLHLHFNGTAAFFKAGTFEQIGEEEIDGEIYS